MFPAAATSVGCSGAVHSFGEVHAVVRAVPAISSDDPGPGLLGVNPLPSTFTVKPAVPPA